MPGPIGRAPRLMNGATKSVHCSTTAALDDHLSFRQQKRRVARIDPAQTAVRFKLMYRFAICKLAGYPSSGKALTVLGSQCRIVRS